jgi:hypothetical protein
MSYSIDFHFAPVEATPAQWLSTVDIALRRAGLRRLANVQALEVDDGGEVDTQFPIQNLESWEEIAALADASYGIALAYAAADVDLAVYAWWESGGHVACAIDYKQWRRLDVAGRFRVGGILCAIAAALGSAFGYSIVNSTLPPADTPSLETLWAACGEGAFEPELAWVANSVVERDALRQACGPLREVRASTTGYQIVLSSDRPQA